MRHKNGNCQSAGGFCTAVNDPICEALHNAYDAGRRAADVVNVVRCKDCVHCAVREYDIIDELECEFFDVFTDPLDYCSKGERK